MPGYGSGLHRHGVLSCATLPPLKWQPSAKFVEVDQTKARLEGKCRDKFLDEDMMLGQLAFHAAVQAAAPQAACPQSIANLWRWAAAAAAAAPSPARPAAVRSSTWHARHVLGSRRGLG